MNALSRLADRLGVWFAISAYLITRALVAAVAFVTPFQETSAPAVWGWMNNPFLRWDYGHYRLIFTDGYPTTLSETAAFFPGYPLVVWPLAQIIEPGWAAVIVSHLSGLAATILLYHVARRWFDSAVAGLAAVFFCCAPTAMFLSTGYADALFIAFVALSLCGMAHERPWVAALGCGLATGTRPTGLTLAAIVVLWEWLRHVKAAPGASGRIAAIRNWLAGAGAALARNFARLLGIGILSLAGILAHFGFLWHHYGRPDAYFACQDKWALAPQKNALAKALSLRPVLQPAMEPVKCLLRGQPDRLLHQRTWNMSLSLCMVGLGLGGFAWPGRAPRVMYLLALLVFLMAYLPDPVTGGRMIGLSRYELAALPSFIALARWPLLKRSNLALWGLLLLSLGLQVIHMRSYVAIEPAF